MSRVLRRSRLSSLALLAVGLAASLATHRDLLFADAVPPAIEINKPGYGYLVGETVHITGSHLQPGEVVTLRVTHETGATDTGVNHVPFYATANNLGNFSASWALSDEYVGNGSSYLLTAAGAESGAIPSVAFKRAALIHTDRHDYQPGDTAVLTGSGFEPNETVTLQVVHLTGGNEGGAGHEPFTVTADLAGQIGADATSPVTWLVDPADSLGAVFRLTAIGGTSKRIAVTAFTDVGTLNSGYFIDGT